MKFRRYAAHMGVRSRIAVKRWSRRLLFLIGGIAVGLAAIAMAYLADHAQMLFTRVIAFSPYAALIVTPAGFALAMLLAVKVFPNSRAVASRRWWRRCVCRIRLRPSHWYRCARRSARSW
jgi:hypothetical protein